MFGINLQPEASKLQEEVETLYQTEVLENGPCEVGLNEQAASCVSNGTPIIKFNPQIAPNETEIVHELYHLKLTALGFPQLSLMARQDLYPYLAFIVKNVYDSIEHRLFYPEMWAVGLHPEMKLKNDLQRVMISGLVYDKIPPLTMQFLAHFQASLLSNDPELLEQFTKWYQQNRLNEALSLSLQFLKKVDEITLAGADKALTVLMDCLNQLKPYDGMFEVSGEKFEKKGNALMRFVLLKHIAPSPHAG